MERLYIGCGGPLYPKVDSPYQEYIRDVSAALRRELEALPEGDMRTGLEHRSHAMLFCAASIAGYVCEECGAPAEASGAFWDPDTGYGHKRRPCNARICPRCARRRSAVMRTWGERVRAAVGELPEGWSWKFITLTAPYDNASEGDLSVEGLRERWAGYRKAWRAIWAWIKKDCPKELRPRLGAVSTVELQGTGHVHLHCLFVGPYIDKERLEAVAKKAWPRCGFSKINFADPGAIAEIAKYPVATKGGACESWLGGHRALDEDERTGELVPALVHPVLAARWEIALYQRHVCDRFGAFRKLKFDDIEVDEKVPLERLPAFCECGHRHPWTLVIEPTTRWIARFAGTGRSALFTPRAVARRKERDRYGGEDPGFDAG